MAKDIIADYGATPGTNCTTAFQNAVNDIRNGLVGRINIPVANYLIGAINMAGVHGSVFQGEGPGSTLVVTGQDAAGNWWDLTGSNDNTFRDLSIVDDGTTKPKVLFPWLQTNVSGPLGGLLFDNVNMRARTNVAVVYAYGCGNVGQNDRGGSLSIRDCRLTQLGNADVFYWGNSSTPYLKNSVLQVTGRNSAGITSANATVATGESRAWNVTLDNVHLIDNPPGYGGTMSIDHNATMILENVSQFTARGGSFQSMGDACVYLWSDCQGAHFDTNQWLTTDGAAGHANRWIVSGGGLNTFIRITAPFWSDPGQGFIDLLPGSSTIAGAWNWTIDVNDVAGSATVPFISNIYGGGAWPPGNQWLKNCSIETYQATTIVCPGSIDSHTVFKGPVSVSLPSGASDASHHL